MSSTTSPTEADQIEKANASGKTPVVFIHGLWLLPSSWDRWAAVFEEAGYTALTPGWPDDPETVEEAKAHPEVFAGKTVGQVADHYSDVIGQLEQEARRDGALVRRPAHADRRRPRALGGLGRDRPRAVPRRAAAADLRAARRECRAAQPAQLEPRRPAHLRPVPLRLRQRRERGRGQGAVRAVLGADLGRAALPGGHCQPQSLDRGQGRHEEPRARPAADHVRHEGPHGAARDRQGLVQAAAEERGRDRVRLVPAIAATRS